MIASSHSLTAFMEVTPTFSLTLCSGFFNFYCFRIFMAALLSLNHMDTLRQC